MPLYEYHCKKCGHTFDLMRRLDARDQAAPCPECKSKRTKRNTVQAIATLAGARPDAMMGEGEPEDFLDGDDFDMGDMGMGMGGGHSHGFDDF